LAFLDIWHIMWIFIYFLGAYVLCMWLKTKTPQVQRSVIYGLILINFVIHFVGPAWTRDTLSEWVLHVSMLNICAVLVFVSPFLYWQQDRFLKPGWVYMSIIGALGLLIFPEYAIGQDPLSFHMIRLFGQHALLFFVPILMIRLDHVKLRWRDTWTSSVFLVMILITVIANAAVMEVLGVVTNMRRINGAFQWHPGSLATVVDWAIPDVFMTVPFGPAAGDAVYWPLFYMLPVFILFIFPVTLGINAIDKGLRDWLAKRQ